MKACKSTKTVTGCGNDKPLSEFQKIRKTHDNYDSVCKKCRAKARRKQYRIDKGINLKIDHALCDEITSMAWR